MHSIGVQVRTGNNHGSVADAVRWHHGIWPSIAVVALLSLAALWPALVNGGPFYMADTPSYVRGAASGFFKLFHLNSEWATEYLRVYGGHPPVAGQPTGQDASPAATVELPVTLSGRSIFYGALLFLSHLAGSFWIVVVFQSLLAGASIYLTVGAISSAAGVKARPARALLIGLLVMVTTPVAYFAGYLMPDIFGGLALLATLSLLWLWDYQIRGERVFWFVLLAYSLLVHNVNLTLITALSAVAIFFAWWRKLRLNRYQIFGIASCIVVAVGGQAAFGQVVHRMTGSPPVRPPFVAMRLIADGPGYEYLREHCPAADFIYCRVLSQENPKSDILLWTKDPKVSLFRGLSPDGQRRSAAEQPRFVKAVVFERPIEVIDTAIGNSVRQLVQLDLNGFNYSRENVGRFRETLPPATFGSVSRTKAFQRAMPTAPIRVLSALTAILSTVFLLFFMAMGLKRLAEQPLRLFCLFLFAGIALNAVICGALSGPKGRYEMRLIWVLPLAAGALAASEFERRKTGRTNGALRRAPA